MDNSAETVQGVRYIIAFVLFVAMILPERHYKRKEAEAAAKESRTRYIQIERRGR